MLGVATRQPLTQAVATVLRLEIDYAGPYAAAFECGPAESIRYHALINHDHRQYKCIIDRCWESRLDRLSLRQ